MRLVRAVIATPVGPMVALSSGEALCALEFDSGPRLSRLDARLSRFYQHAVVEAGHDRIVRDVEHWIDAYFAGVSADARALPLDARGTPFECRVWAALQEIPPGATTSYGAIAAQVTDRPNASRAVGLANGANPIALVVPCHRVIGADGSLTGYGGGLDRKERLLVHEERYWPTASSVSRVRQRAARHAGNAQLRLGF